MKIDLHAHTTASDGALTPTELVDRADTMRVQALAITDHDSVSGLAEARQAALRTGTPRKAALCIVPGVEISCRWQGHEIHVLGWCFDEQHEAMQNLLQGQHQARQQRALDIVEKLVKQGVDRAHLVFVEQSIQHRPHSSLTRKHFADVLVAHGYVKNINDAFKKYLGKGQCAYVAPQWCSIEQAVSVIATAQGVSAIAHPLAYDLSAKWLKRLLSDFKAAGGDALEVASGQQAPAQRQLLADYAKHFKLKASVGSDFHAPGPWREIGRNLQLPEHCEPVWHNWSWLPSDTQASTYE